MASDPQPSAAASRRNDDLAQPQIADADVCHKRDAASTTDDRAVAAARIRK